MQDLQEGLRDGAHASRLAAVLRHHCVFDFVSLELMRYFQIYYLVLVHQKKYINIYLEHNKL